MDAQQFESAYGSVADSLASKTRLDRILFLAQFVLETGWGNSQLAHHNNLAGIKYTGFYGSNFDGFAAYDNLGQFEADYLRVLSLPYYEEVRASAGQPVAAQCRQLGLSPWDAGHYNSGKGPGTSLLPFINLFSEHPVVMPPAPSGGNFVWYTVVRGDTLSGLAVRFNVAGGYQAIYEINRDKISNPNLIYIGQVIRIPSVSQGSPTPPASVVSENPTPGHDYIIKHGDSLWAIAQAAYGNGAEYTKLVSANHIANPNLIYAGTRIHIP